MDLDRERKGIEQKFFELCLKVVTDLGLDLYEMNYLPGNSTLRVFIRDPQTDTAVLEDCVRVDKALTDYIDSEDWMPESLTLEVSSPGMFRDLTQLDHFSQVEGKRVALILKGKVEDESLSKKVKGQKKLIGELTKVSEQGVKLRFEDISLDICFTDIKKANLEPNI